MNALYQALFQDKAIKKYKNTVIGGAYSLARDRDEYINVHCYIG